MEDRTGMRRPRWDAVRAALGGVVLVEVVNLLLNPPTAGDPINWASVAAVAVVGGIIGWMYELARAMAALISRSMRQFEALADKLDYQEQALNMLLRAPRHGEALSELLSDSIRESFRNIAFVDENRYLHHLAKAIEHSDGYEGVQRRPVRWFQQEGAARYLSRLSDRRMRSKIRVFLIDDKDADDMRADLGDAETMGFYWQHTGADVRTFWITEQDFRRSFRGVQLPDDFGLYDQQLLIVYDPEKEVVTFDLLDATSREHRIFAKLRE